MINIKVTYNTTHDVHVYLNYLYQFRSFKHGRDNIKGLLLKQYPDEFRIALNNASGKVEAIKVIRGYLRKRYHGRKLEFRKISRILEEAWTKRRVDIEKQLVKLYCQKIPFEKIYIYLTTTPICPYNFKKREIMICHGVPVERQINILKHELNHFMFYFYFSDLQKELGREKFESLKEGLAILTNPEEKGYPNQRELRRWLLKQSGTIPEILNRNGWRGLL